VSGALPLRLARLRMWCIHARLARRHLPVNAVMVLRVVSLLVVVSPPLVPRTTPLLTRTRQRAPTSWVVTPPSLPLDGVLGRDHLQAGQLPRHALRKKRIKTEMVVRGQRHHPRSFMLARCKLGSPRCLSKTKCLTRSCVVFFRPALCHYCSQSARARRWSRPSSLGTRSPALVRL